MIRSACTILLVLFTAGSGIDLSGQLALGEWKTHLPYQVANDVIEWDNKIFCSSTGGLFYLNLEDNSVETLSKTDGLSDNGVAVMERSEDGRFFILAYMDANIDLFIDDQIINIPDILNTQIPGDKSIYDIHIRSNLAYLSCGFGIVVLDLQKLEISETFYIGDNGGILRVNQITTDDQYIYAATEKGVKRGLLNDPFLIDFNSWETILDLPNPNGNYTGIVRHNDRIYALYENLVNESTIYQFNGSSWNTLTGVLGNDCLKLIPSGDHLVLIYDRALQVMNASYNFTELYEEGKPRSAVISSDGTIWIADNGRGLVRYADGQESFSRPNGPFSSIAYAIESSDGILYAVPGGVTAAYNNIFRPGILMQYASRRWGYDFKSDFQDLISIAVDPNDNTHVYAASWGYGIAEYKEGRFVTLHDDANSSLQRSPQGVIRVGGVAFDSEGNLWATNTFVSQPISVRMADGQWYSFAAEDKLSNISTLGEIVVLEDRYIWGILPRGGGLFAMDYNGTPDDPEDDQVELVSVLDENGKVITNEIYAIAPDLDGNLWLGTDQGILVYYNPSRIFSDEGLYALDICVPRDDGTQNCDPLLQTQKVTAIEVDGANRKWIGTAAGGAFLVSENGLQEIYNFNTGNSPLLSNSITDICFEGNSGEVFFGTEDGIISFKSGSTTGSQAYSKVEVYPNPVREDYFGPIAIKGLVAETTVKITDLSGNIVNEIESFGGQAVWDGTDFNGRRVATGTYLLFLANRDATAAGVAKVMVIR